MEHKPLRVLIARGDVLGDVVVTTPLIEGIRKKFPTCEIYFLIRKMYIPLLSDDPRINGFIVDDLPYTMHKKELSLFFSLLKDIKYHRIDVFLGAWEKPRYGFLAFLARIPLRIGHRSSLWNMLFYTKTVSIDYLDFFLHKVDYNLSLLKPFGITSSFPVQLVSRSNSLIETPYIVLALDAGNPIRILFKEQLFLIVKGLLEQTAYSIVLIGRERNKEAALFIVNEANNNPRVIDVVDTLSLHEVKDYIAHSDGLIGSDSGPVHIAAGFQKPVVVYYLNRIQNACHWGPWMTPHRIVTSKHDCVDVCSPEECRKTTCREFLIPSEVVACFVDMKNGISGDSQLQYWIKTSSTIGLFGTFSEDMMNYLKSEQWNFVVLDSSQSLSQLKKTISDKNINLFLFSTSMSLFKRVKIEVLRRWVSNYMSFFPKIIISKTPFEFELKLVRYR